MLPKFATPMLKHFWPFGVGAVVTYGLVYKGSVLSMNSDEFINDPRHPRFASGGKFIELEK
ncbi:ATPase, F0 complex, subunit J [Yamadazyma tenuis ATCC 10573]|uniref:ATPase, F0 complex, subunit J n=2 Tax=Candida tenuis TaxID=2315449 RepID=G3B535_CANTC|nr:uncharacterized protein CANTEDRAFT_114447 [Yamadazyma tenuis ATCC 10573]XP_006687342.1 ATPase, F0 complex, subunit J [Yamadazyma tenuis ATCC 10573]EGV63548.1 hypothetical protein CANTEDRAFT_114447 [Yamadazyma tenuis ATCC 10573]EGV63549.1 ATPase, F0 complex, subunit J [Yamadazyma tenuis ATCC 10573]